MTVVDMNHSFLLKLKALDRTDIKNPLSYDIVSLLNNAQDIIVNELIVNRQYDSLRPITESVQVDENGGSYTDNWYTSYVTGITGTKVVKLSTLGVTANTTFQYYLRSQSKITRTYSPTIAAETFVQNEEIPKELIGEFEVNGSDVPIFTRPKAILEGDYLILLGDGYTTITEATVVVLRNPKILHLTTNTTVYVTTCELPSYLHEVIVDKAIQIFNETINVNDLNKNKTN